MSTKNKPVVGQVFYVPLYEGGYAFGYITLIDSQVGRMCNFFDLVSETPEVPEGIAEMPVVLHDMLIRGAEFIRDKRMADKQWKVTPYHMPGEVNPKSALFIMRSRPVYQLIDLAANRSKRPATEDEIKRYPLLETDFPPFTTKLVEKAVRHLDIEAKLIGTDRDEPTRH
jgi:hypothetical protein